MPARETNRPIVSLMTHVASDLAYLRPDRISSGEDRNWPRRCRRPPAASVYLALGAVIALAGLDRAPLRRGAMDHAGRPRLRVEPAHRRGRRARNWRPPRDGWNLKAQTVRVCARAHARADARRLRDSEGARAMTAHQDRSGEGRLSTSGEYEREAEATRRRLAENLDELSDRLTPGQVFDEMLTYSRAGGGTFLRAFNNASERKPAAEPADRGRLHDVPVGEDGAAPRGARQFRRTPRRRGARRRNAGRGQFRRLWRAWLPRPRREADRASPNRGDRERPMQ